ncbi:MAG: T9SS type A sorting domain-containing protein [Bacteroidota bacterium]
MFDRPDCVPDNPTDPSSQCSTSRTDVPWEVHPFSITAGGTYVLTGTWSGFDGYLLLYRDEFVPGDPNRDIIGTNDDFENTGQSQIVIDLTPGRYVLVTAGFSAGNSGTYSGTIVGPSGVIEVVNRGPSVARYSGATTDGTALRPMSCASDLTDPQTQCSVSTSPVAYSSRSMLVFQDGLHQVRSRQNDADAVIAVYAGGYDPENPLDNLVAYDDDDFDTRSSAVAFEARANEVDADNESPIGYYEVVTFAFSAGASTTFENELRPVSRSDGNSGFATGYPFADRTSGELTAASASGPRVSCSSTYPPTPATECQTFGERPFAVRSFTPSASGFVNLFSAQQFDGAMLLYRGGYDPANPLTDLVAYVDDGSGGIGTSNLSVNAAAGETYVVVLRSLPTTNLGRFTISAYAQNGTLSFALPVANEAAEAAPALALGIAPNPAVDAARITLTLDRPGPASVTVYDVTGREVLQVAEGPLGAGMHDFSLDGGRLAPGLYVVRAHAGPEVVTRTLTVAR